MAIKRIAVFLCALVLLGLSPLVTNNTFSGGSATGWSTTTTVYTTCASGAIVFAGVNASDQDSDSGYAEGGSGIVCLNGLGFATVGITQNFSIPGTPSAQTWSFWYRASTVTAGDPVNCAQGDGVIQNLILKLNGTTVSTTATPTANGTWIHLNGSTTALVNGANTLTITVKLSGAHGTQQNPTICNLDVYASQPFDIDNVVLSAAVASQQWDGSWRL